MEKTWFVQPSIVFLIYCQELELQCQKQLTIDVKCMVSP